MTKDTSLLSRFIAFFAHPRIVFYTLAWLMVLLVAGTIAQRYVGLYAASETFFYSFFVWVGPVPVPGGLATLGLLTFGLMIKLTCASTWRREQAGIIITHLGALCLLLGGLSTFVGAKEGFITLFPNEQASDFSDYHARELSVTKNGEPVVVYPWSTLHQGATFSVPDTPVTIDIITLCRNCVFKKRDENAPDINHYIGRARTFDIAPTKPEKEDETNKSAILFRVSGTNTEKDGIHLSTDFIDIAPWVKMKGDTYTIRLGKKRYALPFTVELVEFKKSMHPGTDMASAFRSDVLVHDTTGSWPAVIQMNEPLRYRGYTFYQSSFIQDGDRSGTVLAVVKNPTYAFPYIASIIMALGLILHLIVRHTGLFKKTITACIAALILINPNFAHASPFDYTAFNKIPVQDQGRIKPLQTFAVSWLEILSGRDTVDQMSASEWLAEVMFNPEIAATRPVFRIQNPAVLDALGIAHEPQKKRYSLNDLLPSIQTTASLWKPMILAPRDQLSMPQKQLVELIENVDAFIDLTRSVSLITPSFNIHDTELSRALGVNDDSDISYLDLTVHKDILAYKLEQLIRLAKTKKKSDQMSQADSELIDLVARMQDMDNTHTPHLFRTVPDTHEWKTVWDEYRSHGATKNIINWKNMINAWVARDATAFTHTAKIISEENMIAGGNTPQLFSENILNTLSPFYYSFVLYVLACVFFISRHLWLRHSKILALSLWGSYGLAITLHITGLCLRMLISGRPPVTNLYDSIIFVGLIVVLTATFFELNTRKQFFMLVGILGGIILQFIGLKFDQEGDTLRVLTAVLDTNFWLSTHVTCITIGYGLSMITALLANFFLIARACPSVFHPVHTPAIKSYTLLCAGLALLFTAVGTVLGGIWADQSWGRFWGWDPKENGALLIVLWLLWTFHGRYSGHFRETSLMAAFAFLSVIVAVAWFGVNLLGVGLHSYGFTQSALAGFIVFCTMQTILIVALVSTIYLHAGKTTP